jgi:hypothetical protein
LAFPKHGRELAGEFGRDPHLFQKLSKLTNQLLLADVRVAARTAVPGAVVVDVQALLASVDTSKPAIDRHLKTGHHGYGDRDKGFDGSSSVCLFVLLSHN